MAARFDRYIRTAGYNTVINRRQFGIDDLQWPTEYRYPDRTFRDRLDLEVGGVRAELHHARGETDDHAWTWFPDRKVLCTGDLFIWASPNAGNPQKVQRYPLEWAEALRRMLALYDSPSGGPEVLLPGHGYPILGQDRIRQALDETAELLESLVAQTLELMNAGARLDEAIHTVTPPAHLMARPYLQPVYDEPEFVVRSVWRLYGGWWDGNPATLEAGRRRGRRPGTGRTGRRRRQLADRALALRRLGHRRHRRGRRPRTPCAWPGTWSSWPGWPRRATRRWPQARRTVFTRRAERGHLDHVQGRVRLGGPGVLSGRRPQGRGSDPDDRRPSPCEQGFLRPEPHDFSTSQLPCGPH